MSKIRKTKVDLRILELNEENKNSTEQPFNNTY